MLIKRFITSNDLLPKFCISAMPKSGLHLAVTMVRALFPPMPGNTLHGDEWVGSFKGFSFTNQWQHPRLLTYRLVRLAPGYYLKGHIGYKPEFEDFLFYAGITHVFVYRDLRDVAVSQAHHIWDGDAIRLKHPARNFYKLLDGFDEVLTAVIEGIGPLPGVLERWKDYAPWLESEHAIVMSYENMRNDTKESAKRILGQGIGQALGPWGIDIEISEADFDAATDAMVEVAQIPQLSPSFRRGIIGEWQEAFTEEHKDLFKQLDTDNWLVQLGYETNTDW